MMKILGKTITDEYPVMPDEIHSSTVRKLKYYFSLICCEKKIYGKYRFCIIVDDLQKWGNKYPIFVNQRILQYADSSKWHTARNFNKLRNVSKIQPQHLLIFERLSIQTLKYHCSPLITHLMEFHNTLEYNELYKQGGIRRLVQDLFPDLLPIKN